MGQIINVNFQKEINGYEKALEVLNDNYIKVDAYYLNVPKSIVHALEKEYKITFIGVTVVKETRRYWEERLGIAIESAYLPIP